jgi:hypothetical protein
MQMVVSCKYTAYPHQSKPGYLQDQRDPVKDHEANTTNTTEKI